MPAATAILAESIGLEPPTGQGLWETILTAMISPAVGEPHLPEAIEINSEELCDALVLHLQPLGVACTACERLELDEILDDLSASLNRGQQMAAMIDTPGVTLEHVGGLFAAAAEFYRQRPWREVPGDVSIKVRWTSSRPIAGTWSLWASPG